MKDMTGWSYLLNLVSVLFDIQPIKIANIQTKLQINKQTNKQRKQTSMLLHTLSLSVKQTIKQTNKQNTILWQLRFC